MDIISGELLESLLEGCSFRFDSNYADLSFPRIPIEQGELMLEINLQSGKSYLVIEELGNVNSLTNSFLKLERIQSSGINTDHIYVNSWHFVKILLSGYDVDGPEKYKIHLVKETVGLKNNYVVKRLYNEYANKYYDLESHGYEPKDYYEDYYGFESEQEKVKFDKARMYVYGLSDIHQISKAIEIFSELITANPTNSFALFEKGYALIKRWTYEKNLLTLQGTGIPQIEKMPKEIKEEAFNTFKAAIDMNPYLIMRYDFLEAFGELIEFNRK